MLADCTVPQARGSAPAIRRTGAGRPECMACLTGPDLTGWRRVGTALGEAGLPGNKKPDAVDAWVAPAATKHGSAVIFTSDPDGIQAHLAVLNPPDVHVQRV
ncbi:hypothetical protein [Streptomyces sp. NPDC127084]|uniref:hypothetical protein n=1 Tax=Streptomyces sp. NPDC127084 TaxID=3347133 RepID=UPI00364BD0C5